MQPADETAAWAAISSRLLQFWLLTTVLLIGGWFLRPQDVPPPGAAIVPVATVVNTGLPGSSASRLLARVLYKNEDSWRAMRAAWTQLKQHPDQPLYDSILATRIKFVYPPSSLLPVSALAGVLGPAAVSNVVFNTLSFGFLAVMVAAVWRCYQLLIVAPRTAVWLDHVVPVVFILTNYAVLKSVELGQIQTWLNCLFSVAVLCLVLGRRGMAGFLMGLVVLIKPQMALLLPWAIIRKDWSFVKGMAAVVVIGGSLSLVCYGLRPHLEYLETLATISRHGEAYVANQSFNGLVMRMLHLGDDTYFEAGRFAPYNPVVYFSTLMTSLLLIGYGMFYRLGDYRNEPVLSFCLAAVCFTAASPLAWEHHYGLLPVVFVVCLAATARRDGRWNGATGISLSLAVAYILTAVRFAATHALRNTPFNFLESLVYFGVLLLLATIYVMWKPVASRHVHIDGAMAPVAER
jgi:alpha-1,2-mannosyltransferase